MFCQALSVHAGLAWLSALGRVRVGAGSAAPGRECTHSTEALSRLGAKAPCSVDLRAGLGLGGWNSRSFVAFYSTLCFFRWRSLIRTPLKKSSCLKFHGSRFHHVHPICASVCIMRYPPCLVMQLFVMSSTITASAPLSMWFSAQYIAASWSVYIQSSTFHVLL